MAGSVITVGHPLVQDRLTRMRRHETPIGEFRRCLRELSGLLLYEATRDLPLAETSIETPVGRMAAPSLAPDSLCLVPILRAGMGLLDGMLELVPSAVVAFIGLYRDEATLRPVEYYFKAPDDLAERFVLVIDPMLATGNSAAAALDRLVAGGARRLRVCCVVAAPEGVARVHQAHPEIDIVTAALDQRLDAHGYIVPGLGDAGDRLYGTL